MKAVKWWQSFKLGTGLLKNEACWEWSKLGIQAGHRPSLYYLFSRILAVPLVRVPCVVRMSVPLWRLSWVIVIKAVCLIPCHFLLFNVSMLWSFKRLSQLYKRGFLQALHFSFFSYIVQDILLVMNLIQIRPKIQNMDIIVKIKVFHSVWVLGFLLLCHTFLKYNFVMLLTFECNTLGGRGEKALLDCIL